jgi:hypothetical protein
MLDPNKLKAGDYIRRTDGVGIFSITEANLKSIKYPFTSGKSDYYDAKAWEVVLVTPVEFVGPIKRDVVVSLIRSHFDGTVQITASTGVNHNWEILGSVKVTVVEGVFEKDPK